MTERERERICDRDTNIENDITSRVKRERERERGRGAYMQQTEIPT